MSRSITVTIDLPDIGEAGEITDTVQRLLGLHT